VQGVLEILIELRADYRLMAHGQANDKEPPPHNSRAEKNGPGFGIHPGTFAAAMILASN
jgi:hypothetical protein